MSTATEFINALSKNISDDELDKVRRFFHGEDNTQALGVRFGIVFKTAKVFKSMSLDEINILLDSPYYEVRMGAVSIMDYQAKDKKISDDYKKQLFDLYINRHDRLNNWDFVDRAAPSVIGGYLWDKPRDILYQLAQSDNVWERRTAIVSTYFFIRQGDLDDTYRIAEILLADSHELVQKAVGSWLREAGKYDEERLKAFLDVHVSRMARITLRYAVEKFDKSTRTDYLKRK